MRGGKCPSLSLELEDERPGAKDDEGDGADGQDKPGAEGNLQGGVFRLRFFPVHGADNLEVVVEASCCADNHDRKQPYEMHGVHHATNDGDEGVHLGDEAQGEGNTGQGGEAHCDEECCAGIGLTQATEGGKLLAATLGTHHAHSEECCGCGKGVGKQVLEDEYFNGTIEVDEEDKDETGLTDGGVAQETLDVALVESAKVTDEQGDGSHDGEAVHDDFVEGCTHGSQATEGQSQDAEHGKTSGLGTHGQEGGGGGGCTLVDVRNPDVHGSCTYLEEGTDEEQRNGHEEAHCNGAAGHTTAGKGVVEGFAIQAEGAGGAEIPCCTEYEDTCAHGTQYEILDAGFDGTLVAAEVARQNVGGQGDDFQAHEEHDEILSLGEAENASACNEGQGVEFAGAFVCGAACNGGAIDLSVVEGKQQGKCRGDACQETKAVHVLTAEGETCSNEGADGGNECIDALGHILDEGVGHQQHGCQCYQSKCRCKLNPRVGGRAIC